MNKRILELAKHADNYAKQTVHYYMGQFAGLTWEDKIKQSRDIKFAELIVLECVNAVMDGTKEGDHYAMRIEKHFDSGNGGILYFGDEE